MKGNYHYSPELKAIFSALNAVKKSRSYSKLPYSDTTKPEHAGTLRRAYLMSLQTDLLLLSVRLDQWRTVGMPMETTEK